MNGPDLRRWLARHDLPAAWLARRIGVSRQAVASWCSGTARPSPEHAATIARLVVALDSVFGGERRAGQ